MLTISTQVAAKNRRLRSMGRLLYQQSYQHDVAYINELESAGAQDYAPTRTVTSAAAWVQPIDAAGDPMGALVSAIYHFTRLHNLRSSPETYQS